MPAYRTRQISKPARSAARAPWIALAGLVLTAGFLSAARAADLAQTKGPAETPAPSDPWNGFYLGGHLGRAGGKSNWSGPDIWDSSGLAKQIDSFTEAGSFLGGFQAGYNLLLPSRLLIGLEGDFSLPAFPDVFGQSTGVTANFNSLFPFARACETYYNYALTPNIKVGLDYQVIMDPAYDGARGPANLLAARLHWQF